jgi:oxygen-independent coproporphyrinogen-3 oxidase
LAGLYIHIPYCKKACFYCNFHFTVNRKGQPEMLQAILEEARRQRDAALWNEATFSSLYLGGGTPSVIEPALLADFLYELRTVFPLEADAEFTLEANPDDVNPTAAATWLEAGVNRISLGLQSLNDEELRWMNRSHNAKEALDSLDTLLQAGFPSVNADLIYGGPLRSDASWLHDLDFIFNSGVDHLSAYALTLEERTPYEKLVHTGRYEAPEEQHQARQFEMLCERAEATGWDHYEISNLAKPGHRARHNSAYWKNQPYLGLGPSAHSYDGAYRSWNPADNASYIRAVTEGMEKEGELLGPKERYNEWLMTHLRMREGLNLDWARQHWPAFVPGLEHELLKLETRGWVQHDGPRFSLSRSGRLYADAIAAGLMQVGED